MRMSTLTLHKLITIPFFLLIFLGACKDKKNITDKSQEESRKTPNLPLNADEISLNQGDVTESTLPLKRGLASRAKEVRPDESLNSEEQVESFGSLLGKAESGEAIAQFKVAGIYEAGSDGVPKNLIEAARWYRMAAEQDHAQSQYNLGMMYQSGHGVGEDANQANKWFDRYNQNKTQ